MMTAGGQLGVCGTPHQAGKVKSLHHKAVAKTQEKLPQGAEQPAAPPAITHAPPAAMVQDIGGVQPGHVPFGATGQI